MIRHGFAIFLLTVISQLGGIAWLLALILRPVFGRFLLIFLITYLGLSIGARYVAPATGRVALPCVDAGPSQIAVLNPLYCALNRNYVTPEMKVYADRLAAHMHDTYPGTRTRALDGSFPFFDNFPLRDFGNRIPQITVKSLIWHCFTRTWKGNINWARHARPSGIGGSTNQVRTIRSPAQMKPDQACDGIWLGYNPICATGLWMRHEQVRCCAGWQQTPSEPDIGFLSNLISRESWV